MRFALIDTRIVAAIGPTQSGWKILKCGSLRQTARSTRLDTATRTNRVSLCRTLSTAIAAGLLLVSCASPGPQLPAITRKPERGHHIGKIVWLDLITADPEIAKRFYGKLFAWNFYADPNDAGYFTVYLRDYLIGGITKPPTAEPAAHHSAWLTYLATRDVETLERTAVQHGAKVLSAPRTYVDRGTQAVFMDPQGAVFAVLASSSGDPPDVLVEPGRWIWSTVLTHDVPTDSAFYQAILGYTIDALPQDQGLQQVVLESDGYARATVNELPHDGSGLHSRWINFVRVENVPDTVARAVALGGRTLVGPHLDRHGGRVAVIADPQGAWFGVMEWPAGARPRAVK